MLAYGYFLQHMPEVNSRALTHRHELYGVPINLSGIFTLLLRPCCVPFKAFF